MFIFLSCVDPFEPSAKIFEDLLVVEAIVTDEFKKQSIILTRSYKFETELPVMETGAMVVVMDNLGNDFQFEETEVGKYVSQNPFKIEGDKEYTLLIVTADGKSYRSTPERLQQPVGIDNVYANRIKDDLGTDGMAISIDNSDNTGLAKYFRYEYEETYKIIAPFWLAYDFKIVGLASVNEMTRVYDFDVDTGEAVIIAPKDEEERVCYTTNRSNKIILGTTNGLDENRLVNFKIRFIESENYIISHRYSILVKQFVISPDAYNYYRKLRDIASSESLLSQNQYGFLVGNMVSQSNPDEKIIGFFEVSSVSTSRLFFNYKDYYPTESLPPYINECRPILSISLIDQVRADLVHFNDRPGELIVIPRECGDCTALGSNVKPEFWID